MILYDPFHIVLHPIIIIHTQKIKNPKRWPTKVTQQKRKDPMAQSRKYKVTTMTTIRTTTQQATGNRKNETAQCQKGEREVCGGFNKYTMSRHLLS